MTYEVVGLLGRGGSAVVELAVDGDGRRVATKRLALTGSAEELRIARRRFRREAEILGRLAHPGIVPILDVFEVDGDLVLVLPAMTENLEDRIRRLGPLPAHEVVRIGGVLIEALAVAHRAGVVHRDIKPANVLFDGAGRPALADFGVAVTSELTSGLTATGMVIGTPMWMSPEQARGDATGPATDVFSLAATLCYAASGTGPYAPGPPAAVMHRAAAGDVRAVPVGLPAPIARALASMLDPRPQRRPSAARVLGGLGDTGVGPAPRSATGPSPARRALARVLGDPPETPSPRRRMLAATAALLAVAVAGALLAVGLTGTGSARTAAQRANRPMSAGACVPEPYLPCGAALPAPHTNGRQCDPGWYDLDGQRADGCEAHSDYRPGSLTAGIPLRANVVPTTAVDAYTTSVSGDFLAFCWGSMGVTLTAPRGAVEELALWQGGSKVATALSYDGQPATATVDKPSCLGSDAETFRVTVSVIAAPSGASAADFTLTRNGGW